MSSIVFDVYYVGTSNKFVSLNLVDKLDLEIEGNMNTMTSMCGTTEARKNGNTNWKITFEGLAPLSKKDELKTLAASGDRWLIKTQIHEGNFYFDKLTITDISEEREIEIYDENGNLQYDEYAISFQGTLVENQTQSS
jgi:hypothetical protein